MNADIRAHILRLAQDGFDNPERGLAIWGDAEAVLAWLDATEAPPSTHTVRVAVDVSPLLEGRLDGRKHHERVYGAHDAPPVKGGWKRSIGIIHSPVPGPIDEIVGTVEVS